MSDWHHPDHNNHLRSVPVHRGPREFQPRDFFIALGIAVLIVVIIVAAIWSEKPRAKSIAGALPSAAGTVTPAAATPSTAAPSITRSRPPTPSRTPVEVSPPLKASAGDGTWLVGKQIKRGVYRTAGDSSACFWALRSNLAYDDGAIVVSSHGQRGAQTVAIGPNVAEFITYGCGSWKLR